MAKHRWSPSPYQCKKEKKKRNYDCQDCSQTLWFCVRKWYWKLCISNIGTIVLTVSSFYSFKSREENKNFEISTSILFSPSCQELAFTVRLTEIFENVKGFWVTKVLQKEFKRSQKHVDMLHIHILNYCPVHSTGTTIAFSEILSQHWKGVSTCIVCFSLLSPKR